MRSTACPLRDPLRFLSAAACLALLALGTGLAGCADVNQQPYSLALARVQVDSATREIEMNVPFEAFSGAAHISPSLHASSQNPFDGKLAQTIAVGRVYGDLGQSPARLLSVERGGGGRTWAIIPYLTLARQIGILRAPGSTDAGTNSQPPQQQQQPQANSANRDPEYLLPGFEAGLHGDRFGFHLSSELYSYQRPRNAVIKAGVSYPVRPDSPPDYALIVEQRAWDVALTDHGTDFQVSGSYQALYLKRMIGATWNASVGLGAFHQDDRSQTGSAAPLTRSTDGVFLAGELSFGLMDW
jgi:hypothetical protein